MSESWRDGDFRHPPIVDIAKVCLSDPHPSRMRPAIKVSRRGLAAASGH